MRVLYIMIGMPSCYNSGLTFAQQLQADGLEVTLACDRDIRPLANAVGLDCVHLDDDKQRFADLQADITRLEGSVLHRFQQRFALYRQSRRASLQAAELLTLVTDTSPDVLLIDAECHYAIVATRSINIPTLLVSRWFDYSRSSDIPPLHSTRQPARTRASRLRNACEWHLLYVRKWWRSVRAEFSRRRWVPVFYRTVLPVDLKQLARVHGESLNQLADTRSWLIPHVYPALPVLSMTTLDMDFPRPHAPNFHCIGPMVGTRNLTFDIEQRVRDELTSFIDNAKAQSCKLIYCSLGTWLRGDVAFLQKVITAVQRRPDLAMVLSLGGTEAGPGLQANASEDKAATNILIINKAPQIDLLAQADLALLHAGSASLHEAISLSVPLLVYSVGTNDQNGCAERIRFHELGEVRSLKNATEANISDAITAALNNVTAQRNVQRFADQIEWYDRAKLGVRAIREQVDAIHPDLDFLTQASADNPTQQPLLSIEEKRLKLVKSNQERQQRQATRAGHR